MTIQNFEIGERIAVNKSLFITHFGIYVGDGMVIDNSAKHGRVEQRTLQEFAGQGKAYIIPHTSIFSPSEIVARAKESIGKSYRLLSQNCEHFVTGILFGKPRSKQVAVAVVVGTVSFLIWRLSKK